MSIQQFLFTLFCTVIFCLGFRLVTSPGYILYFLRKPFDDAGERADVHEDRIKTLLLFNSESDKQLIKLLQKKLTQNLFLYQIGKPLIWCITCYGSVWGCATFLALNGWSAGYVPFIIINCFGSAFINTFIWKAYVKIDI